MNKTYEDLFHVMNQFRNLRFGDMFPNLSRAEFYTLSSIMDQQKGGKITISELAAKARVLPSAMSRTLRGLEEKGLVERNVNKNDRRNTYVELTKAGEAATLETRKEMGDFGRAVMSQVDEEEIQRLISYLNNIYAIAQKELEKRKKEKQGKKGEAHEEYI